jgi:SWI/SNF-related matrix-associated actin-dependent regulator 1 of chromatin subfamily A
MRYCGPKQDEIFVRGGKGKKKLVWSFDGGSNLPELQARLRRECMIRRKKEDVLRELPPRTRQIIPVSSQEIQDVVYKENDFFFRGERTAEPTLAAMVAMACDNAFEFAEAGERLIAAALEAGAGEVATMRQEIAMAKMPICLEHIENLLTTKAKVVVMAHHRIVVETITEKLEGAVKLYGGMTDEAKAKAVDDFQNGNAPVFVGSLQAAGVGLTLTAADTMVFVEDDWVPSVIFQAEDRIHRIGQTNPVLIQHIVADGTIDAMIVQSVIAKQRMIDEALDAPKEPKRFERASDEDRAQARIDYQTWASEDSGVLQTSDSTKRIVNEIAERCERRPPTDGEVSLWKRLRSKARSRS